MQTDLDAPTSFAPTSGDPTVSGASSAHDTDGPVDPGGPDGGTAGAAGADTTGADAAAGSGAGPSDPPARRDPLALVVAGLVLVPAVAAIVSALRNPFAATDDWALMELQVRAVGTGDTPLLGAWSRFGWDHPGPWALWLLAPFYRLVPADHGLLFAAGMCNLVALAACVALALRRPRAQALVLLVGLAALARGLGVAGLGDPWNPMLPIVPFALFCLSCIELAIAPRRWLLAVAVGAGSLAVQAHIGFVQPVVLVGATTAGLAWWRARGERAPGDDAPAGPRRRLRFAWPAGLVCAVAWFPVALDQVAGQGNAGRILRWAAGDDAGVPAAAMNEGALGADRVVHSAAWLMEPFGLWVGRYTQTRAFGLDLLGTAPAHRLLWVPAALGLALLLARRLPGRERWPIVCSAAVAGAGLIAAVTDLMSAEGAPVSWPFRWVAVPVMLVWVVLGWSVVGAVGARAASASARADGAAADGWRARAARWVPATLAAGSAIAVVGLVGLTVWRGSMGVQPRQERSELLLELAPAIEEAAGDDALVAANSTILLDPIDLGTPVVLDRAGIDWVEWDDPRAASVPRYSVGDARALDGLVGWMVDLGQVEVVARTGPPADGGTELVVLRWLPPDEQLEVTAESVAALAEASGAP